jgi:hypothetical protein
LACFPYEIALLCAGGIPVATDNGLWPSVLVLVGIANVSKHVHV